jgi:hypothetical protein
VVPIPFQRADLEEDQADPMGSRPPAAPKPKRSAQRVSHREYPSVPGHVSFSAGAIRGQGILLDISATGAHVYMPTKIVPRGVELEMFFLQSETERKLYAVGEVVRRTESGFAVRFVRVERELETLILAATGEEPEEPVEPVDLDGSRDLEESGGSDESEESLEP